MANLFYKVSNEKADNFKTNKASDGVIGFVDGQDGFGYLLANGQQYGPTKAQITSLISNVAKPEVATSSTTFQDKDGNEISLTVGTDGKLSLSKYTAAKWSTLSITAPTTTHQDAKAEYGSAYALSCGVELSQSATVLYTISAGTETISNRKVTISYFYAGANVSNEVKLSTNNGIFTVDLSGCSASNTLSGTATVNNSITVSSKPVTAEGTATASKKGALSKSVSQQSISVTATLTVQERWIQHTSDITVSKSGTSTTANGHSFLAGTVTSGTKNLVDLGSKPTSFTATNGQKCYLAFKKSWGTPSFSDPNGFTNTSWKAAHDISIYGSNDYSVYVFVGTDGNAANMNAAGAGTWKVSFK